MALRTRVDRSWLYRTGVWIQKRLGRICSAQLWHLLPQRRLSCRSDKVADKGELVCTPQLPLVLMGSKKQLPYQLLSDPQRTLIGALGAAEGNKTKRSHFVFDKGGKLLDKKIPVKPADRHVSHIHPYFLSSTDTLRWPSPRLALEFIRGLGN